MFFTPNQFLLSGLILWIYS